MTNEQIAKQIIAENLYMTLATTDGQYPWASPVFYAETGNYEFYFFSSKDSLHAMNIENNPHVSAAIFTSTLPPEESNGVQIKGQVEMIKLSGLITAIKNFYSKRSLEEFKKFFKDYNKPEKYWGASTFRFYKLIPEKIYVLDRTRKDKDVRVKVQL